MLKAVEASARFLSAQMGESPRIGMITGTGLGSLTEGFSEGHRIPYRDIPHFPRATAEGHKGALVWGKVAQRSVVAMEGRFHLYEGHPPQDVAFPVRVMARLGVEMLLISSAAGGLNPLFTEGDLMLVTDHINFSGANPLVGPNADDFGPRFPDMARAYDPRLNGLARKSALEKGLLLREGVYVGVLGPSLETPAETRFLRMAGGDAVGMSTVMEATVGVHCGIRVMAIVVITNVNLPDCMEPTSIEAVIDSAERAGPALRSLWESLIPVLPA